MYSKHGASCSVFTPGRKVEQLKQRRLMQESETAALFIRKMALERAISSSWIRPDIREMISLLRHQQATILNHNRKEGEFNRNHHGRRILRNLQVKQDEIWESLPGRLRKGLSTHSVET
jgi:hypothetical protein